VRYLVKYLTMAIADPLGDHEQPDPAREAHITQPDHPGPGLIPGRCPSKVHEGEHLGCGGRRVLVSRD
jgi:hypothetical protein